MNNEFKKTDFRVNFLFCPRLHRSTCVLASIRLSTKYENNYTLAAEDLNHQGFQMNSGGLGELGGWPNVWGPTVSSFKFLISGASIGLAVGSLGAYRSRATYCGFRQALTSLGAYSEGAYGPEGYSRGPSVLDPHKHSLG